MNTHLQNILSLIEQDESLTAEKKSELIKSLKSAGKEFEIVNFKLERTEKVKRTTAILLEETIEELEQKRKAVEAQNKELEIEASLEKVRSRSLAVHKSDEFKEVISVVFEKMQELAIPVESASINIFIDGSKDMDVYACGHKENGLDIRNVRLLYFDHPIPNDLYNAHQNGLDFFVGSYEKKEKDSYYEYQFQQGDLNELPAEIKEKILQTERYSLSVALTKNSIIIINNFDGKVLSETEINIQKRFAKVFEQTYTRFLDLQKAEAQAKEAIRQASLDRVRGQIASMRSTEDLQRITPLIWHELTAVGIPFIRCGVFIIDESKEIAHVYLTSPDGHPLAALNLPFGSSGLTKNVADHWLEKKVYHQHWNKDEFINWSKSLIAQGQIQNQQSYQGAAAPPESLDLHFIPFTQGMLYVGNTSALQKDDIDLVKSLAEAFSIAYARYEDFNKLEKAKQSIESTLTELKSTQSQLIQSEKMASLGELTAGIAHEIQNPLNFVNNFSDVNKELLEELIEEANKGNIDEVKAIAGDVISNEEKINHHGKRADSIVKGMLQHSRSSSATKEPTDINALADEYLRLSYHGLRAKDKSFNATIKTDFDESLEKINIIPQDIGRLILNLLNNAFYAVNEKQKRMLPGYDPVVSVSTKKLKYTVEISVHDNGNGIPQKVLDKIFQPFFTTKPTGQGTGLGLSLSYDIVKAHGGEIKAETKEGEGSIFIIQIPIT